MNEQEYIKKRIDEQFNWYDKKSGINKKKYQRYKALVIFLSVSIPFMTGFITEDTLWLKVMVGVSGVLIALIEGLQSLYKYQDNWLLYRNAAEFLTREKLYYTTKSGPYISGASLQKLVVRVESFTSEENKTFASFSTDENNQENNP